MTMHHYGDEAGNSQDPRKWAYITIEDFRATSNWTVLGYIWLWIMALAAVAVYALDTFTAVNLLVLDQWSSQVKPAIPMKYTKWIFAACILFSWALCAYEWIRAIRVIRRGGVADSYMDYVARNLQCIRPGGWRRFLVFAELTKSKKGVDYIAFFVYFAFTGAIRIILAEGPRQFVNAITLYSVMVAKIEVHGKAVGRSQFDQFFFNLQQLAHSNPEEMLILCSMLFTLVIWMFSMLCLIAAVILYLVFLWHYIPHSDARLKVYCRRKVDKRLERIVQVKIKTAVEEDERKAERLASKRGHPPTLKRQPTLPEVGKSPDLPTWDSSGVPPLLRSNTSTTVSTLPLYPGRSGSQRTLPEMPRNNEPQPVLSRSVTPVATSQIPPPDPFEVALPRNVSPVYHPMPYVPSVPESSVPARLTYGSLPSQKVSFSRPGTRPRANTGYELTTFKNNCNQPELPDSLRIGTQRSVIPHSTMHDEPAFAPRRSVTFGF